MPRYEWRGASAFHDHRNDRVIEPGDTVELDAHIAEPQPAFVAVEEGDSDESDDEAEPPFDPGAATVEELRDTLDKIPDDVTDAELDALYRAETEGKNRETALDAIDAARE